MTVLTILFSFTLLATIHTFQPNCDPYNQFRSFCFSVEYCDQFDCYKSSCGQFSFFSRLVRIKKTQLVPKCAFTNSETLETIDGRNSEIEILASGAFKNLTGNLRIDLSFNKIKELQTGIFDNVLAYALDLSWNKILYIQEGALVGLPNLYSLNLSKNALKTFPIHQLPPKLSTIDFSYNFLDEAVLTSRRMPSLNEIDLGNNNLKRIAFSMDNPVRKINLFDNRLQNLDLLELPLCDELNIGKNNFLLSPESLNFLNLKKISLYPNPWHCDSLRSLWTTLQNNLVTLIDNQRTSSTGGSNPLCSVAPKLNSTKQSLTSRFKLDNQQYCKDDSDCDEDNICRSHRCWNPCENNACGASENCTVKKHKIKCSCPKGTKKDQKVYYSECQNKECFVNRHCSNDLYCNDDNVCASFNFPSQGGSSASSGGYGGSSGSSGGYGGSNAGSSGSSGGYGGSSGGYGGSSGGYGGSYSGSGGGFVYGEYGGSNGSSGGPDKNEWWRYEISETQKEQKKTN